MASSRIAPAHLSREAQRFYRQIRKDFDLGDQPEALAILQVAGESWDRLQAARAALDANGTTYTDRFGAPRTRPEVAIERDARVAFLRALRELGLGVEDADGPRPPRVLIGKGA